MFISIDVGNSNIVFGFFNEERKEWVKEFRIETKKDLNAFYFEKKLSLYFLENDLLASAVTAIGFSTVVPSLERPIVRFCEHFFPVTPYTIKGTSYGGLAVYPQNPDEIGSDLMANMVAAYQLYQQACIVVDFGTALTFSILDDSGKVIGVNIVPGIKTAIHSLFLKTAKLPKVKMEMPDSVLGKNTVESIQAGIFYGYTGLVKGMLEAVKKETGISFKIVATGGLSSLLTNLRGSFDLIDEKLTLKGIKLITEANHKYPAEPN